jgi:hypothetical protein
MPHDGYSVRNASGAAFSAEAVRMLGHQMYDAITVVNCCGHGNELILVPEADGWCGQVPVLGGAT